ncbi:MAG: hypothetical protein JWN11_2490, partial [Hyphomicrobiales bacterium]|nr:hypothetical protein [Hyphomicrobiales bacterium]
MATEALLTTPPARPTRLSRALRFMWRRRSLSIGAVLVGIIVLAAILAPLLTRAD